MNLKSQACSSSVSKLRPVGQAYLGNIRTDGGSKTACKSLKPTGRSMVQEFKVTSARNATSSFRETNQDILEQKEKLEDELYRTQKMVSRLHLLITFTSCARRREPMAYRSLSWSSNSAR